jgi:ADP-ribosylglycohydrolase
MRAPVLGVCCSDDPDRLCALVTASTRITHADPRAEAGALAVALAARRFSHGLTDGLGLLADVSAHGEAGDELFGRLRTAVASVAAGEDTPGFAATMGCADRVSGYMNDTVPVALHAALSHPDDLRAAVLATVACGRDTDTTAAIAGGLVGAHVGSEGIPADWLAAMWEFPQGVGHLERLAAGVAGPAPLPRRPAAAFVAARNVAFLAVVLSHGLRRLLPPYG